MAGLNKGRPVAASTGLIVSLLRAASRRALLFFPCSHSLRQMTRLRGLTMLSDQLVALILTGGYESRPQAGTAEVAVQAGLRSHCCSGFWGIPQASSWRSGELPKART